MTDFAKMIVSDIMFVETKNTNYVCENDGIVFDDGTKFHKGDYVRFGNIFHLIKSIPEVDLMASGNWIKVTFKV